MSDELSVPREIYGSRLPYGARCKNEPWGEGGLSLLCRILIYLVVFFPAFFLEGIGLASSESRPLTFGVINQRSPTLTAEYWNPILDYVSAKSGVPLELMIGRATLDTVSMAERGELDFIYSNNLFTPDKRALGFRVIARPDTDSITGQIVVLASSPLRTLADLNGREVVFPSTVAFVAYQVTGDALVKAGVSVRPLFAGNQEGAMAQLKVGRAEAASVNSAIMADFAKREGFEYRILWSSPGFLDIPIMAAPSVPEPVATAVRDALVGMGITREGQDILTRAAKAIGAKPVTFVAATDADYETHRRFSREAALDQLPK